ncbi:MAG: phosphoglucosamine mutase [Acidimicrobiales bacterium]
MLRFGTDGIRGVANSEITPELALALGRVAALHLPGSPWLVGRDTRRSGPMLLAAFAAGLAAEGRDVLDCGVIPTPGLAWLAGERGVPAAMVSASHNPFGDNGIKLFARGGSKLSLEDEAAIQDDLGSAALQPMPAHDDATVGTGVGTIAADTFGLAAYADRLVAIGGGTTRYQGRVVVDCANGSASVVAPGVLARLGVDCEIVSAVPDGANINDGCGSTHIARLQAAVLASGAGVGIAFDGDADRMLAVDNVGSVVDGDQLIAMFAADLNSRGELAGGGVVATLLSNLGLRLALSEQGIDLVETPVGDRHVADAMETSGYVLGGEQSGHLIFRQHAATGDGVLTALQLLDLLARAGVPLADLAGRSMQRVPQVMLSVPVADRERLAGAGAVWAEVKLVSEQLGASGRVVLRPSGTEPAVRVMVEGPTAGEVDALVRRLAEVIARELA